MAPEGPTLEEFYRSAGITQMPAFAPFIQLRRKPFGSQQRALTLAVANDFWGIYDETGCVSCDTEFLTPAGWKRMDEWQLGDSVAQFDPATDECSFFTPTTQIRKPCSFMYRVKPARGTDQLLSPEHRVLCYGLAQEKANGGKVPYRVTTAEDVFNNQTKHNAHAFKVVFKGGQEGVGMSDATIRLMVAVVADGHFPNRSVSCVVRLLKERKRERLRTLLAEAGVEYEEKDCLPAGFRVFKFKAPFREKEFGPRWWKCSHEQLKIVTEEARFWDGYFTGKGRKSASYRFSTAVKASADFIQYAASATGNRASLSVQDRRHLPGKKSLEYNVHVAIGQPYAGIGPRGGTVWKEPAPDGMKYCFTTETGFLILRRNGFIFTTGNSGKTIPAMAAALFYVGFGNKVLVLTLPILQRQFQEDLRDDFAGSDRYVNCHVLQQAPDRRAKLFAEWEEKGTWPQFMVMTYELFATGRAWEDELDDAGNPTRDAKGRRIRREGKPIWKQMEEAGYNVVITDETQKIRGITSTIYKRVQQYVGRPDEGKCAYFPLTGTPMYTSPFDAYALIELTNPDCYASFESFERRHGVWRKIKLKEPKVLKGGRRQTHFRKLVGFQRLEELNRNLYKRASRTMKIDIPELRGLKSPVIREVPVELHVKHLELYRRLANDKFLELEGDEIITALQEQELRQKVLQIVSCPHAFATEGKAPENRLVQAARELMTDVIDDRKVIMFANYRMTVESLAEQFKDASPAVIYGGMTPNAREAARNAFLKDDRCRLLVANAEAAGAGLNLQSVSHTVIFFEPTAIPGQFKQAMDRVVRPGQEYECMVYILKALHTVAVNATKDMLRRDTSIAMVNRDRKSLRHYYDLA